MSEPEGKTLLGIKLDKIASLIADETIATAGQTTLIEKCAVLKTLDAHYATVHKIEPSEEIGGAFAKYRNQVSASSSGGTGSSRDANGSGRSLASPERGFDSAGKPRIDLTEPLELD